MKRLVLIFGIIAGIICGGMFFLKPMTDEQGQINFDGGQYIGYITMIVALSSIFFAVKQYRDKYLDGTIKFGKAFVLGILITFVASIIYVSCWELFLKTTNLDFSGQYVKYLQENL